MTILETQELSKHFGGLVAVNKVSINVEEGEIVGLIGPNGAGKTTLLNAMAGLNPPTSGKVVFKGKDVTGFTPEKMCKRGLSRTFQIPMPFPKLSVLDNVLGAATFGLRTGKVANLKDHCRKMLEFVEFPLSEDTISENLNTVQLKRLDLARALASDPKMLFLDELAAGLTQGELGDIINIIHKVQKSGVTILMVEHIMELIMNVCQRLIVIQFGKKIADGPTDAVSEDPLVTEAYLGTECTEAPKPEGAMN